MIERNAYSALMKIAKQFPVVAITGPRQSGKSTLTKYAFSMAELKERKCKVLYRKMRLLYSID